MKRPLLLLLLTLGIARAQEKAAPPPGDLASLVPAETMALIELDDLGGFERWSRETALGRIWSEPEVQHFVQGLKKTFDAAMTKFSGGFNPLAMIGLEEKDLEGITVRRIGAALIDVSYDGHPRVDAVLTVQFRGGAENGRKVIDAMQRGLELFLPLKFEPVEIAGEQVKKLVGPGYEVFTYVKGDRLIVTMGAPRMNQVLTSLKQGSNNPLRTAPRFATIRQRMGADRYSGLVYADMQRIYARGMALGRQFLRADHVDHAQAVCHTLGVDAMDAIAFADIPSGTGFRTEFAVTLKERRGVFGLMPQGKPSHRFAKHAPANCLAYGGETFDLDATWNGVMALVEALHPPARGMVDEVMADANQTLGVDIKRDIVAALGTEWAAYVGAPPGGGVIPDFALFVTLRDRERLAKAVETVLAKLPALAAEEGVILQVKEARFRGTRIRYIEMTERDGDPIPFAPAWATGEDYCVFALVPQSVKHALMEKQSIAANPDYRELTRSIPSSAVSSTYYDLQGVIGWLYNTAVPALQAMQGVMNRELALYGLEVNLADLPPAHVITRHLGGMMSYTAVENDCVRMGFVSPFGAAGAIVPLAFLVGLTVGVVRTGEMEVQQDRERVERRHARAAEVERLRAENEMLRRRLQKIEEEIAEVRKLLDK